MKKIKYITLALIAILLSGCISSTAVTQKNQKAICMSGSNRYELVGNDTSTEVSMYQEAASDYLSDKICSLVKKTVEGYDPKDGTYKCDGKIFTAEYTRKESLTDVINDYKTNLDYYCVTYGNDKEENTNIIKGTWTLKFTNGENKYDYKLTFYEDGTIHEYKVYGKSGEYVDDNEGVYSFDGEKIYVIFKGDYNYSYEEYLSYNSEKGTIVDSNIRSEFPNEYTKTN